MKLKRLSARPTFKRLSKAFRPSSYEENRTDGYTTLLSSAPSRPSSPTPALPDLPELEGSPVPTPLLNVQPPTPKDTAPASITLATTTSQRWTDFQPLSDLLQPPLSHPAWSERPFMRDFQSSPQLPPARRWSYPSFVHPAGVGVQLVAELSVVCGQGRRIDELKAKLAKLEVKGKTTPHHATETPKEGDKTATDHQTRKDLKTLITSALSLTSMRGRLCAAKTELARTQQRLAETQSRNERLGTFLGVLSHRVAALEEERRSGVERENAVVVECGAGAAREGGG